MFSSISEKQELRSRVEASVCFASHTLQGLNRGHHLNSVVNIDRGTHNTNSPPRKIVPHVDADDRKYERQHAVYNIFLLFERCSLVRLSNFNLLSPLSGFEGS